MSKSLEHILCAALYYNDKNKYDHQPDNIEIGIVITGLRHSNCMYMFSLLYCYGNHKYERFQGFLTSTNRFVDRKEAYKIALKSRQLLNGPKDDETLYSEDLYTKHIKD
jgi:hypothetical protein